MHRRLALAFLVFAGVFLLPLFSDKVEYAGRKVESVRFVGLKNVHPDELTGLISMQAGEPLPAEAINQDVKSIFGTGYFSSVILRLRLNKDNTVTVYFEVIELPRISEIKFMGTDELYATDLKEQLSFREGEVYSAQKVKEGVQRLQNKYRDEGFFLAEIWSKVSDPDPETNQVEVTYVVDEGENVPIARINITGTRNLDAEEMVALLEMKEKGAFEDGVFKESKFEEDKMKILAYAKTNGYIDAEIDPAGTGYEIRWKNPKEKEEGRVVVITYKINEGEIRYYGGYSLEHDAATINKELNPPERKLKKPGDLKPIYPREGLLDYMEYSSDNVGEVFDEGKYFRDRGLVQELYSQQGYVFTQVQPVFVNYRLDEKVFEKYEQCGKIENAKNDEERKCKREAGWLDLKAARKFLRDNPTAAGRVLRHIHFTVRENGLAYIENIIIKGMVKTQERVIRRELLMKEGQLFNSALVNRSREKLVNLGYFKEVNLEMRPGSDDQKMNLIIDLKEQPTGTISMGGGYGTQSGFAVFTEVGENNLGGSGQKISGRLEYGPLRRSVRLEWSDPWIYEKCENTTGSFWRNKSKEFDNAPNLETILRTADSLQNAYRFEGEKISSYVKEAGKDSTIETLDRVKQRIRALIFGYVAAEEECFRSVPRPWAMTLFSSYGSARITTTPIRISDDSRDHFEGASYEKNRITVGGGVSHTFLLNWVHYHRYTPSWSTASKATSLVDDRVFQQVGLGWQFKSSFTNGLIYDTRDNVYNTTSGLFTDLSMEVVGQALGGEDHYNQYNASAQLYWWWFDYSFGGLFRKNSLRRWRVVQEVRVSGIFTHETAPYGKKQNKDVNPYIEQDDRLLLGGYEGLRGYNYQDRNYPQPWRDGGSHMILASTELRFPIEPSILWFVFFFDGGALYDNIGEYNGDLATAADTYDRGVDAVRGRSDPMTVYLAERYNTSNLKRYPFESVFDWDNPKRAVLSQRNVALDRMMYSWGVGLRVQIPVMPLRLFFAQKRYYKGNGKWAPIPGDDKYEFVFGIGDFRY